MGAQILDGTALAKSIRLGLREPVRAINEKLGRPPGLGVVLVGDDEASAVYVRNKEKAAKGVGMHARILRLPRSATQAEVFSAIDGFNNDPLIDGFLLQLPLPPGLDEQAASERISASKDADGLLPLNLGRLAAGLPGPRPCTPAGVMRLIDAAAIDLAGKHAVVVGRSTIVGKPQALMLLERHATVTLCHSRTTDLAAEVARADVLVVATGVAECVKGAWIKPGAVVIDVGINRVDGALVGDVEFAAARERASFVTPVPGGVGPMTIAMLLANTVRAAAAKAEVALDVDMTSI